MSKICVHCKKRKGKFVCPAYHDQLICSICCGKYRQNGIDCVEICEKLKTVKETEKAKEDKRIKENLDETHLDYLELIERCIFIFAMQNDLYDKDIHSTLTLLKECDYPGKLDKEYKLAKFLQKNLKKEYSIDISKINKDIENEEQRAIRLCFEKIYDSVELHSSLTEGETSYLGFVGMFVVEDDNL